MKFLPNLGIFNIYIHGKCITLIELPRYFLNKRFPLVVNKIYIIFININQDFPLYIIRIFSVKEKVYVENAAGMNE